MAISPQKSAAQLGMSMGKAQRALERQILFSLVADTGRDMCYRCGKRIERWQDMSVDHKQAWLDVSAELFWDLNNIAFSHRNPCNSGAGRRPTQINSPAGMNWCSDCKGFRPVAEFYRNVAQRTGWNRQCKEHKRLRNA